MDPKHAPACILVVPTKPLPYREDIIVKVGRLLALPLLSVHKVVDASLKSNIPIRQREQASVLACTLWPAKIPRILYGPEHVWDTQKWCRSTKCAGYLVSSGGMPHCSKPPCWQ